MVHYFLEQGENIRFRPVHRLDRGTSGLVLVAKSAYIHHQLAKHLAAKLFTRRYIALVHGQMKEDRGTIREPIGLANGSFIKRIVTSQGKEAVSRYYVLRTFKKWSLVVVELETGRTHQVRVHLSHLGNPLLGDNLYGGDNNYIDRPSLHCGFLAFTHPQSSQVLKVACPIPKDMRKLLG
nr:RNA pseudouridine synthase [Desulforamulus aquiferis]